MKTIKRASYGTQLIEWMDAEMIARRYNVADIRQTLRNWVATDLVETKAIPVEMVAKFDALWVNGGSVVKIES